MNITIGTDPEFFLIRNGKPVSAHDLLPGSKDIPHELDNGAVQVDGTAVEFNINPAKTAKEFANNVAIVLSQVREMVPPEYSFFFGPTVQYPKVYFKKIPLFARSLGCSPDYNAYLETFTFKYLFKFNDDATLFLIMWNQHNIIATIAALSIRSNLILILKKHKKT